MGFRFRKSFQLVPGLRLNVGTGGLSVTAGIPGMSVGIGRTRTSLNLGIPGTGLSYNHTLLRHGQGGRSGHRTATAEARDAVNKAIQANQLRELDVAQGELRHLVAITSILNDRVKEPFDLFQYIEATPTPLPSPYKRSQDDHVAYEFDEQASVQRPIQPWLIMGVFGCIPSIVIFDGPWIFAGIGIFGITALVGAMVQQRRARKLAIELAEHANVALSIGENRQQELHEAGQQKIIDSHMQHERIKEELRNAIRDENPGPICTLLEAEMANEVFPVPVMLDLEFDGLKSVVIEVPLPEFGDIPMRQPRILTSGKVGQKPISQADRVALLECLCCGIALRLTYESFRVVPMIEKVEFRGTFEDIDGLGRRKESICMNFTVTRQVFAEIDLDRAHPPLAIRTLGRFNCNKKGEFRAIDP